MEKIGFKCFNEDMTNRYGKKMEIGSKYTAKGNITVGNYGHGFHFCENLEDTFRYFDSMNENVCICLVKGFGNIAQYEDEYNGYYNIYAAEHIEIIKKLSRKEIIDYGLNLNYIRACRFVQGYKLTNEEIELFKEKYKKYSEVIRYIEYYQIGNLDVFKRRWFYIKVIKQYLHFNVADI